MSRIMLTHTPEAVFEAATILNEGGLVVFPSDTTYGIACDIANPRAIARLLKLKQRTDNRFTVIAASLNQVDEHLPLTPPARAVAEEIWPAPVSIIVNERYSVRIPTLDSTIGIPIAHALGRPIIATSANISGKETPTTIDAIQNMLGEDSVELWIDGGERADKVGSTVIHVHDDYTVDIVRVGAVTEKEVQIAAQTAANKIQI